MTGWLARHATAALWIMMSASFLCFVSIVIFWQYFDDEQPYRTKSVQIQTSEGVEVKSAKPGDVVYIFREWCAPRSLILHVGRQLRRSDSLTINIDTREIFIDQGCGVTRAALPIPLYTPSGAYAYQATLQWTQNPVRERGERLESVPIRIIAP